MRSMSGFGKYKAEVDGKELNIEIRCVNHKALDLSIKMPKFLFEYEDLIRKIVGKAVFRGHVDVFVTYNDYLESDKIAEVNIALARSYVEVAELLSKEFSLENRLDSLALMKVPEVVKLRSKDEESDTIEQLIKICTEKAVESLVMMREVEGEKLYDDIKSRMAIISGYVEEVKAYSPVVISEFKEKLMVRVQEILGGVELDHAKLMNEIAYFVDKCNIDEETTRLNSHIHQFYEIIERKKPVGKELDFLLQEFFRECNTICSKANNLNVTKIGLKLKNEVEKVREQIMNIE